MLNSMVQTGVTLALADVWQLFKDPESQELRNPTGNTLYMGGERT